MPKGRYDFADIADSAAQRLVKISERASTLARGVGFLAAAAGATAYAVGLFTMPSSFRLVWAVAGIIVCSAPAMAVFVAARRLRRVRTSVVDTAAELRAVLEDRALLKALTELVEQDEDHEARTPLVTLGRELNVVRKAASGHKDVLINAWQSITAIATLPGLVALATIGAVALFAFSAIAVVVRLVLLAG